MITTHVLHNLDKAVLTQVQLAHGLVFEDAPATNEESEGT